MLLAVYANEFRNNVLAQRCSDFINGALAAGHRVLLSPATVEAFLRCGLPLESLKDCVLSDEMLPSAENSFIISLGGDGTFLRAARWSGASGIPVVGVNLGHLGYLPSFNPDDLSSLTELLETGNYRVEERSMLKLELPPEIHEDVWPYALNEITLLKQDTASMITIPVTVDNHAFATYRADGLIVSTPTGSTGYNLSVGGPILQPTVPAWVIAPIADHSLTMRPMVVSDRSVLEMTATGRTDTFRIGIDGNSFVVAAGTSVKILKAPFTCRVVMKSDSVFSSALRSKLLWGESAITPDDAS